MDFNELFITEFATHIGHPVEQDEYDGDERVYFVFAYEDENPILHGNNFPMYDKVYIQLKMYTPKSYDYFPLKKKTSQFFEKHDFVIPSKHTFLTGTEISGEKLRCTVFSMEILAKH